MTTNFLQKAMDAAKTATKLDTASKYNEAQQSYQIAIEYFLLAIKYEKNKKLQETIRGKIQEYLERAEKIKGMADKDSPKKKLVGVGESHKDDKDDDPDKKALYTALMSAIVIEKPNVKWSDVSGLDEAKSIIQEAVILPLRLPHLFTGTRKPWRGILLYGPPGTGKSYLAKAVATEANNSTFISVSSSDLVSKWQGQSERLIKTLFDIAREKKPCIIFIDEVDSMCSSRSDTESESSRRIKTEFLVQMQGVGNNNDGILVLGATNVPWVLDSAFRRRFEKRIYIPLPDVQSRLSMFKRNIETISYSLTDADFQELALATDNYSGADISVLVRDAIMEPIRKVQTATHFKQLDDQSDSKIPVCKVWVSCSPGDEDAVEKDWTELNPEEIRETYVDKFDMLKALRRTKSSINKSDLEQYETWTQEFGQEG